MSDREVTIEGSLTPSTFLPRGERRTVVLTDRVQRLVDRGFVVIVGEAPPEVDPKVSDAPGRNESSERWFDYLTEELGLELPDEVDPTSRTSLLAFFDGLGG